MKRWEVYGGVLAWAAVLGVVGYLQRPADGTEMRCGEYAVHLSGTDISKPIMAVVDGAAFEFVKLEKTDGWTVLDFADPDGVKLFELRTSGEHTSASLVRNNILEVAKCEPL